MIKEDLIKDALQAVDIAIKSIMYPSEKEAVEKALTEFCDKIIMHKYALDIPVCSPVILPKSSLCYVVQDADGIHRIKQVIVAWKDEEPNFVNVDVRLQETEKDSLPAIKPPCSHSLGYRHGIDSECCYCGIHSYEDKKHKDYIPF